MLFRSFEARKLYFETGHYIPPNRDLFKQKLNGCLSTRYILICDEDLNPSMALRSNLMSKIEPGILIYRLGSINLTEIERHY